MPRLRGWMWFLVILVGFSIPPARAEEREALTVDGKLYVKYSGNLFEVIPSGDVIPPPDSHWYTSFTTNACWLSGGAYGSFEPRRFVVEGLLTRRSGLADSIAPEGYTARLLVQTTVADGLKIIVPNRMAEDIERLAAGHQSTFLNNYSIAFLVESRRWACLPTYFAVDYIPVGKSFQTDKVLLSLGQTAWEALQFGLQLADLMAKLKGR